MKEKGLAPIIIVLLIALGIGGYLVYQNQNKTTPIPPQQTEQAIDKTANWKLYTNKTYGYSIKYPPEFYVKPPITEKIVTFVFEKDKSSQDDPEKFLLIPTIGLFTFEGKSLEDQVAHFKSSGKAAILKQVEIAGNKAYRAENINVNVIDNYTTISEIGTTVAKNNNLFIINVRGSLNQQPELVSIYNQMLTTFRFQKE